MAVGSEGDAYFASAPLLKHEDGEGSVEKSDKQTKEEFIVAPKVPGCIATRHVLAFYGFLGFVNVYAMRVNLSVAMTAMVNGSTSAINASQVSCPVNESLYGNSTHKEGEFNWDSNTKEQILASFFYGYILTQIPGGFLGDKIGGKWLFGLGVLCTAIFTLLTPIAADMGLAWLIAVRVLAGIGEGVTFPAMNALWAHWAPPVERSRLLTFTYAGSHFGTVLALPISGVLSDSDFLGGWPSVFYVFGVCGVIWFVLWSLLIHDYPEKHPRISQEELTFLQKAIQPVAKKPKVPWFEMLTSVRLLAISVAHFSNNWGFYTLLTNLPSYLKFGLGFDISQSGFLAAVPYLVMWILINTGGQVADYLRGHYILTTTQTRKLFTTLGLVLPAVFLVITGYIGCDHVLAVAFLALAVGMGGLAMSGFNVNHLDIAPAYAGVLMGITNTVGTVPGILGPSIVGLFVVNQYSISQWQIAFWVCFGVYMFGALVYFLLGTGELQPWADPERLEREKRQKAVNHGGGGDNEDGQLPYCQYDISKSVNGSVSHTGDSRVVMQ
ncbi:sialin-like [Diadema setosum]|uniref:sialin-like n=1 Tax=Diadema setosum TaxID=31175 RepID=UPI003B3B7396